MNKFDFLPKVPLSFVLANRVISTSLPAFVMGIVNVTPDSFYQQSRANSVAEALDKALLMVEQGADIIDIGGESTRPGSDYVSEAEELERVLPFLEALRKHSAVPVSIDTRKKKIMQECLALGADILNDVSALEDDTAMIRLAAEAKIPVILMHKRGNPAIMQDRVSYINGVQDIADYLFERASLAEAAGISADKIILDPGVGFGKDLALNSAIITDCGRFSQNGKYPVLIGLSRKTCIGQMTGRKVQDSLAGTLAANLVAVACGARFLRVHDVAQTVDALVVLKKLGEG